MKQKTPETRFSAYSLISKKRDGLELTKDEIEWFINSLTNKSIADYQMSAMLMAIYIQGMNKEETAYLTDAMLNSGRVLSFEGSDVIDKHSTGGVGDKASFILAPIAAACGVKVPMIAGRGLGHTGGTVDKIESIPGFKVDLPLDEFTERLKKDHIVLIGQTSDLAPADKKIYALRDVTATIESIPLITASIMSKKLAEGANGIVMDIKTGNGAFMANIENAKELALSIRETGKRFNKSVMTLISDMSTPLGNAIGNSLEIIESIETLKNKGPKDLTDLSLSLAGGMIYLASKAESHEEGIKLARKALEDGSALETFRKLIRNQDGDDSFIDDYSKFKIAKNKKSIICKTSGYLASVQCKNLGLHSVSLGGGRMKTEDKIDFGVGIIWNIRPGDKLESGQSIGEIYFNDGQEDLVESIIQDIITKDIEVTKDVPKNISPLIMDIVINKIKS